MIALYANASKHFDIRTGIQFEPHLVAGVFVGIAHLTEQQAESFTGREGFEILSEEDLQARLSALAEATSQPTGDPVSDSASPEALAKLNFNELMKLAKARGLSIPQGVNKAEILALLSDAEDPLGAAPAPPSSGE